nr:MAG TPA_asm: hypothetical protein [Caudoviricetes sp.]
MLWYHHYLLLYHQSCNHYSHHILSFITSFIYKYMIVFKNA